ncbi:MAG: hypothetical protein HQL80_03265 [Magnetococcales bacterium]|nr:hypothetical protein [Magnetococcales bacterium]
MKTIEIVFNVPRKRRNPVVRFAAIMKKGGVHQQSCKKRRTEAKKAIRVALVQVPSLEEIP